jgi:hypothetical protein
MAESMELRENVSLKPHMGKLLRRNNKFKAKIMNNLIQ